MMQAASQMIVGLKDEQDIKTTGGWVCRVADGDAVRDAQVDPPALTQKTYAEYRAEGGYALWLACLSGQRDVESVIKTLLSSSSASSRIAARSVSGC